jgi:pentatricopeptide repeat protein
VQGCERSVITYSSLISACEKAGEWELALQLFDEMGAEGCVPNVISYNSLITACAQGECSLAVLCTSAASLRSAEASPHPPPTHPLTPTHPPPPTH